MEFNFREMKRLDRYKLMTSTIVPRPIGFVTSLSKDGIVNAAPFSFFNGMASEPPTLVLGLETYADIAPVKDTGDNIRDTGEFVVALVNEDIADQMNLASSAFPPEINELEEVGLTAIPATDVAPPLIAEAPVNFECRRITALEMSGGSKIIIGEILRMHVKDEFVDMEKLYVDTPALKLIGRMHGTGWYARTSDLYELKRPNSPAARKLMDEPPALGSEKEAAK
jgi:flavin reductase (DIM6/NTAB) family NADH-FMN oxidoreductase RutF